MSSFLSARRISAFGSALALVLWVFFFMAMTVSPRLRGPVPPLAWVERRQIRDGFVNMLSGFDLSRGLGLTLPPGRPTREEVVRPTPANSVPPSHHFAGLGDMM